MRGERAGGKEGGRRALAWHSQSTRNTTDGGAVKAVSLLDFPKGLGT